jgi:hypothetical protein
MKALRVAGLAPPRPTEAPETNDRKSHCPSLTVGMLLGSTEKQQRHARAGSALSPRAIRNATSA